MGNIFPLYLSETAIEKWDIFQNLDMDNADDWDMDGWSQPESEKCLTFMQSERLSIWGSWHYRGKTTIDWGKISKLSTASLWVSREMERITISLILCKRLEKIVTICMLRLFEFGAFVLAEATPSEPFIVSLIRLNLAELQEETESKMGIHTILQKHK